MLLLRTPADAAARFTPQPPPAPTLPPMARWATGAGSSNGLPPAPPPPAHPTPTPPQSPLLRLLTTLAEGLLRLLAWLTPTEHCPTCGAPADRYATLNGGGEVDALPWLLEYQCWVCERTWRRPLLPPSGCDL